MKKPLHVTIPIQKIDEEQRMVYGYATVEELDSHGDIITYDASKKAFSNWIGNIREMHGDVAVGKAIDIEFDDEAKGVWLGARISESDDGEQAWIKIKEGVYAGFSIGGSMNAAETKVMDVDGKPKPVRVITDYDLGETSIVDNPAVSSAVFQMVKRADSGELVHEEKMLEKSGRPVQWWERLYKYSDSQDIMKASVVVYNEDSMSKEKNSFAKSLWEAGELIELAECLSNYIYWKTWDGEDTTDLQAALESIKAAAAAEALEPEVFPEVETAIENAAKALNIKKREELQTMANDIKVKKSVVGQEDRDADANVVTTAEENGKPVEETTEVAEVETTEEVDAAEATAETTEEPEEAAAAAEEETEEEGGKKDKGKKSAPVDFTKATDNSDLTKSILAGVEGLIEKAVAPLKEEIDTLKRQPAISKAKSTYSVKKGEDVEGNETTSPEGTLRKEFDDTLKRSEELAKDANAGTPEERTQVAFKLRKLSRQLDPESQAKHAAIKATFQRNQ